MRLIIMYGPPGAGKLTIAEKLADLTGLPLFHNHASADLLHNIFPEREQRNVILNQIRFDIFEYAAKVGIPGLIFTFVYRAGEHDEYFKRIVEIVNSFDGRVDFVQLVCDPAELEKRVQSESRQKHNKIVDVNRLKSFMSEHKLTESYPSKNNYILGVTKISPEQAAEQISKYLGL